MTFLRPARLAPATALCLALAWTSGPVLAREPLLPAQAGQGTAGPPARRQPPAAGRLTPEERQKLRQAIRDQGRNAYAKRPPPRR